MTTAASMHTPVKKKRTIQDFFQKGARERIWPSPGNANANAIPQKRPSPSPEPEIISPVQFAEAVRRSSPVKHRVKKNVATSPSRSFSPVSIARSGSLPIRSPHPKSASKPAQVYKSARLFDTSPFSQTQSPQPQKTPTALTFANVNELPKSTQAVVKEGKIVGVRDSDGDDSDSLLSLDEIFGVKRADDDTSLSSPPEPDETKLEIERRRVLSAFTYGKSEPLVGKDMIRKLQVKEKERKLDLTQFITDHLDDEEAEQSIQKSREQYAQSKQALESGLQTEVDAGLLAAMVQNAGGDEDDIARLLSAVSRTEALSLEKSFLFFGTQGLKNIDAETHKDDDFPNDPALTSLFKSYDDTGRSRACLSGYVSELAGAGQISDDVFKWTFNNVLIEKDDDLRQSYVECLTRGSPCYTRTNIDVHDVQKMFERLGGQPASLKGVVQTQLQSLKKMPLSTPRYLLCVLDLFEAISLHMDFIALASLTSIVCRMTLDEELMSQGPISAKVEEVLQTLINLPDQAVREHVSDWICKDLGQHLDAPTLQAQLLSHLLPVTSTARTLRIRLALMFLLGSDSPCLAPNTPALTVLSTLTHHLTTAPSFDTSLRNARSLNYTHLRARTSILDAAISNGHIPPTSPFPSPTDEISFNQAIDTLADAIHARYTAISDSGASHISRTEAKDALTAVYYRVLIAVRTKPRPKKHVFDVKGLRNPDVVKSDDRSRRFFKDWRERNGRGVVEKREVEGGGGGERGRGDDDEDERGDEEGTEEGE